MHHTWNCWFCRRKASCPPPCPPPLPLPPAAPKLGMPCECGGASAQASQHQHAPPQGPQRSLATSAVHSASAGVPGLMHVLQLMPGVCHGVAAPTLPPQRAQGPAPYTLNPKPWLHLREHVQRLRVGPAAGRLARRWLPAAATSRGGVPAAAALALPLGTCRRTSVS